MSQRYIILTSAFFSLSLFACGEFEPNDTLGDLEKTSFSYKSGNDCFFLGCELDRPMMSGTKEVIALDGEDDSPLRFESSQPDIVSILGVETKKLCCDSGSSRCFVTVEGACSGYFINSYSVTVQAENVGESSLRVIASDGNLYDSISLHVEQAVEFSISKVGSEDSFEEINLSLEEEGFLLDVDLIGTSGRVLQATQGVEFHIEDANVASLLEPELFKDSEYFNFVELDPQARGETTLHFQTGSVHKELMVRVR